MSTSPAVQSDAPPIVACTVSRDVQNFDLLIEDMEAALGDAWGDLSFDDAEAFLGQPEAASLQFIIGKGGEFQARRVGTQPPTNRSGELAVPPVSKGPWMGVVQPGKLAVFGNRKFRELLKAHSRTVSIRTGRSCNSRGEPNS